MTSERRRTALERMLEARSVAVVGASVREGSVGHQSVVELVEGGFEGRIIPVNPKYDEVLGHRAFESVAAIGEPVDLVILAVSNALLEEQLRLAADAGARSAQPRDSVRAMFARYFTGAAYRAWEDLEPPRITLSDDGSLAAVLQVVCVDREEPDDQGERRRRVFVTAYSSTYHWQDGGWRMQTVASTFRPDPPARCAGAFSRWCRNAPHNAAPIAPA